MREDVHYLTVDDVLAIIERYMRAFGYAAPLLRSGGRGLLESAVNRAQTLAYYASGDLIEQAAALAIGILLNHPFVDGNKRSAMAALLAFLDINGRKLPAEQVMPLAWQIVALHELTDRAQADPTLTGWLRAALGDC
jgi:death on curing protein